MLAQADKFIDSASRRERVIARTTCCIAASSKQQHLISTSVFCEEKSRTVGIVRFLLLASLVVETLALPVRASVTGHELDRGLCEALKA